MKTQTFYLIICIVSIICSCNNLSDNNKLNTCAKSIQQDSIAIDLNKLVIDTTLYKSFNDNHALVLNVNDSFFIFNKFQLNKEVYLIDNTNNEILTLKTLSYYEPENISDPCFGCSIQPDTFTFIGYVNRKVKYSNIDIAVLSDNSAKIKLINFKEVFNEKAIHFIDSLIKSRKILQHYYKKYSELDTYGKIESDEKKLEYFEFHNQKYYVFTYVTKDYGVDGCKFIIFNNILRHLSGPSSYPSSFAFTIDDEKLFINTGTCCSGCGITEAQIYEIVDNKIILKFEDASFSN